MPGVYVGNTVFRPFLLSGLSSTLGILSSGEAPGQGVALTAAHPKDARAAQPLSSPGWVWRLRSGDFVTADPESRLVLCLDLSSLYSRGLPRLPCPSGRRAPSHGGGGPGAERRADQYRPARRAFRAGLHGFRFAVRAGLRGGLRTQGAATEGLCSFSLSCDWRQVEVGAKLMEKNLTFCSEPGSPPPPRAFLFRPAPPPRRRGEFRSTRGAEPSSAWASSPATRGLLPKQRGTAEAFR